MKIRIALSSLGLCVLLVSVACGGPGAGGKRYVEVEELPVVAWFEDYDAVLSGTYARSYHLFPRALDLKSSTSSLRCAGPAPLVQVPVEADPPRACDGMSGVAELRCSDDRVVRVVWIADPDCRSGYGQGTDQEGHRLHMIFGGSPELARTALREAVLNQDGKPHLPVIGSTAQQGIATGTAFFVTSQGHLVTNHHVVAGATRVLVSLEDGELIEARVLLEDDINDLALLEVDAIRTPLPIGPETALERGMEVVALGYPLVPLQGREQKATIGHVNALSGPAGDERFTQIDAAIQPGNSGGPLLNRSGEVVGVVTMMLNPAATFEAVGVVPQNVNYAVKPELVQRLMRLTLGSDWERPEEAGGENEWPALLSRVEDSVVLVVAEP